MLCCSPFPARTSRAVQFWYSAIIAKMAASFRWKCHVVDAITLWEDCGGIEKPEAGVDRLRNGSSLG
jgi:hypothetical protein